MARTIITAISLLSRIRLRHLRRTRCVAALKQWTGYIAGLALPIAPNIRTTLSLLGILVPKFFTAIQYLQRHSLERGSLLLFSLSLPTYQLGIFLPPRSTIRTWQHLEDSSNITTMGLIQNPIIPDELCTLQTCSLLQAHFTYLPNMAGNILYTTIFGILLILQIGFGVRYKTWGYLGGMFGGLLLEIIGYAARVQMHSNPFLKPPFLQ